MHYSNVNVPTIASEWHRIHWKRAYKIVKNLRGRIFKATRQKAWKRVRGLQKLLLHIPKANDKQRPLGIPTIVERCLQAIVKNALEPTWEAQFEGCSYGFRSGRSAHDAIEKIYGAACPHRTKKWVVDADIKGCFDHIDHQTLLNNIGNFRARGLIAQWLNAGYLDKGVFHPTEAGPPPRWRD